MIDCSELMDLAWHTVHCFTLGIVVPLVVGNLEMEVFAWFIGASDTAIFFQLISWDVSNGGYDTWFQVFTLTQVFSGHEERLGLLVGSQFYGDT